jgi:hypothetical protein
MMGNIGTERRGGRVRPLTEQPAREPLTAPARPSQHRPPLGSREDMTDFAPADRAGPGDRGMLRAIGSSNARRRVVPTRPRLRRSMTELLERASCAADEKHVAPEAECRCGLYAWYLRACATVSLGPASAVIRARGAVHPRGPRPFAPPLPGSRRGPAPATSVASPWAASRARQMLTERYTPGTRVYAGAAHVEGLLGRTTSARVGFSTHLDDRSARYRSDGPVAAGTVGVFVRLATYFSTRRVLPRARWSRPRLTLVADAGSAAVARGRRGWCGW